MMDDNFMKLGDIVVARIGLGTNRLTKTCSHALSSRRRSRPECR
jgi:hypothetical protein